MKAIDNSALHSLKIYRIPKLPFTCSTDDMASSPTKDAKRTLDNKYTKRACVKSRKAKVYCC
jgi:hypothetical protein